MTLETRKQQLIDLRRFIERKTNNLHPSELILLCGDFNVNGRQPDFILKPYCDLLAKDPDYKEPLDMYANEYATMISILSGHGRDVLLDFARRNNDGVSPITFADTEEDDQGDTVPREKIFITTHDKLTK